MYYYPLAISGLYSQNLYYGHLLYYEKFALSLRKENPYIFSKFNSLYLDPFYGPLGVLINRIWL